MSAPSPRLHAAIVVRQLSLSGASELETSRALLAELSALLRTYYRRTLVTVEAGGELEEIEHTERVGPVELQLWWAEHRARLVELHRELALAHLEAAGVAA